MLKVVKKPAQEDVNIPLYYRTPAPAEPFWPRVSRATVVLSAAVALHMWIDTAHLQQPLPSPDRPLTMVMAAAPAAMPVLFSAPGRTAVEAVRLTVEEVVAYPVRTFEAMAAGAMSLARSEPAAVATTGVLAASRGPDAAALSLAFDAAHAEDDRPPDVVRAAYRAADPLPEIFPAAAPLPPLERPRTPVQAVFAALPRPPARGPAATLEVPSVTADTTARERQIILDIVNAYSRAFERLDARAAKAVSPSLDDRALQKAFARLEGQKLRFEDCRLSIEGAAANARCLAHASYTPKIGSRVIHLTGQQWTFNFSQSESGWQIVKTTIDKTTLH